MNHLNLPSIFKKYIGYVSFSGWFYQKKKASPSIGWLGWLPVRFSITCKVEGYQKWVPAREPEPQNVPSQWHLGEFTLEGWRVQMMFLLGSMLIYRGGVDDGLGGWGFYTVWVILKFFL